MQFRVSGAAFVASTAYSQKEKKIGIVEVGASDKISAGFGRNFSRVHRESKNLASAKLRNWQDFCAVRCTDIRYLITARGL